MKLPALLLRSFSWEIGVQSFSIQQEDRAWAALPQSQAQVGVLRKVARQLSSCEGKTLLPHSEVEMSKKEISGAGCSWFASFQSKPWDLCILTQVKMVEG